MDALIYGLCSFTALLCAWLLLKAYVQSRRKLLLWGGLCFVGITANNVLLIVDKLYLPDTDLSILRHSVFLLSMMVLLYGLIWDSE